MIYFLQDEATCHIKIGFTENGDAETRLRQLQTGNPSPLALLGTMLGDRDTERRLHLDFAAARVAGEWFRPVSALLQLILEHRAIQAMESCHFTAATRMAFGAFCPSPPFSFYLAGKIALSDWRHSIVKGLRDHFVPWGYEENYHHVGDPISFLTDTWPVLKNSIFGVHHYTGPYFLDINEGHGSYSGYSESEHGAFLRTIRAKDSGGHCPRRDITVQCFSSINRASVVFAWIDELDCFGTIAEIGYALAAGKCVWVSGPKKYPDMWFVSEAATSSCFGFDSAKEALTRFIEAKGNP